MDMLNDPALLNMMRDPSAQQQIKAMWNSLNEMAETNPAEYSKFIEKQLKEGVEQQSPSQKIQGNFGFCIRTPVVNTPHQVVLMNICYHEQVLPPLKEDHSIANIQNDTEWKYIPISFSEVGKTAKQIVCDAHLNTQIYHKMIEDVKMHSSICAHVFERFTKKFNVQTNFLKGDFNILNEMQGGKNGKPFPHKLDIWCDRQLYETTRKKQQEQLPQQTIYTKPQEIEPEIKQIKIQEPKKNVIIEEIKLYEEVKLAKCQCKQISYNFFNQNNFFQVELNLKKELVKQTQIDSSKDELIVQVEDSQTKCQLHPKIIERLHLKFLKQIDKDQVNAKMRKGLLVVKCPLA